MTNLEALYGLLILTLEPFQNPGGWTALLLTGIIFYRPVRWALRARRAPNHRPQQHPH